MKRIFLNILSITLSIIIFLVSSFFLVPSFRVSASSIPEFDPYYFNPNYSRKSEFIAQLNKVYTLFADSNYTGVYCLVRGQEFFYLPKELGYNVGNYFSNFGNDTLSVYTWNHLNVLNTSTPLSDEFSLASSLPVGQGIDTVNFMDFRFDPGMYRNNNYSLVPTIQTLSVKTSPSTSGDIDICPCRAFCYVELSSIYEPDYLSGFVTGFDYSTESFVQWLIDTEKYQELPVYIGTSKLVSFIDFYKQWGSSNKLFVVKIADWMMHFNIAVQTLENRNILKSTIDRLYQEYCNSSYVTFKNNSANQVHHRNNINTKTDDTDLTLVTDDPTDDTITSILRDILRGVIAIPTSIYNNSQAIISKLDSLTWTVNIANDGGASSGTDLTPVLNKMDDIIDALGSDTVSVEIDQTTKDDTDDFFDNWNLQFSTALNNKFPVASQLRTFFTGFFERCGIDADSDGEVYQYYNPGVLTSSTVSRSAVTASEDDIVTEFLGKFDNSDPAFLDDASYHGVPDLSVSVGGQSVSIIDFRVYAKYREKIHFIISFVIWTLYLLHLYKALPQIIGQVSDVAVKTSDL